ncbi:hypothetical protein V6667_02745 [Neisseria leonii]|uniref:hypothetical protein n=1 Tax=Neisseria leonii TaxID=2995413 RepID=UPI0030CFF844
MGNRGAIAAIAFGLRLPQAKPVVDIGGNLQLAICLAANKWKLRKKGRLKSGRAAFRLTGDGFIDRIERRIMGIFLRAVKQIRVK